MILKSLLYSSITSNQHLQRLHLICLGTLSFLLSNTSLISLVVSVLIRNHNRESIV